MICSNSGFFFGLSFFCFCFLLPQNIGGHIKLVSGTHHEQKNAIIHALVRNNLLLPTVNSSCKTMTKPCVLYQKHSLWSDELTGRTYGEESLVCQVTPEDRGRSHSMFELEGLPDFFLDNLKVISGETTLYSSNACVEKDTIRFASAILPIIGSNSQDRDRRRRLMRTSGVRTVLVVQINAADSTMTQTVDQVSDEIFGTFGDQLNLRSGFAACSYGQLDLVPTNNTYARNGVIAINVTQTVQNMTSYPWDIWNPAYKSLTTLLGAEPKSLFDHVLYCLPPGALQMVAFAYGNAAETFYNNEACLFPSVVMHEIGHNLNMGHSGDGTFEYGDTTCMMGANELSDEFPSMCFNGAKSYYLGWYSSRVQTVDILTNSTLSNPAQYTLIGVSDFQNANNDATSLVIVKLETGIIDYYIAFNRNTGINRDVRKYPNHVIITSSADQYSKSWIERTFSTAGQNVTFENIGGSAFNVTINIVSINLTSDPATAVITITRTVQSTSKPSLRPISLRPSVKPTRKPSSRPTQVKLSRPSVKPTRKPTKRPTRKPTKRPTAKPTKRPTRKPTKTPTRKPTKRPTRKPTKRPTRRPTKRPSRKPTKRPTRKPTGPTRKPTKTPTRKPTRKLTRMPTRKPTRMPTETPTRMPTRKPTRMPSKPPTTKITDSSGLKEAVNEWLANQTTAEYKYGAISSWDVSRVTSMAYLFDQAKLFSGNLSNWNTSNVEDMTNMFANAAVFNGDISTWDTSRVRSMLFMFYNAKSFNSDVSTWSVSSVTNMSFMFKGAQSFNQDLSLWKTSLVTDMNNMFSDTFVFNRDLSTWDTSSVMNMNSMFNGARVFNGNISTWRTTSVLNMDGMFAFAKKFNSDVSKWNISSVTTLSYMFFNAESFHQLLCWNTAKVATRVDVFNGTTGAGLLSYPSCLNR